MAKEKNTPSRRRAPTRRSASPRRSKKSIARYRSVWLALGILLAVVLLAVAAVRLAMPPAAVAPKPKTAVVHKAPVPRPQVAVEPPMPEEPAPAAPSPTIEPTPTLTQKPTQKPLLATAPLPTYEIFPRREVALPKVPPPVQPPSGRPRVALVIDDIGYDQELADGFFALNIPLTVAVLPFSPHKAEVLAAARRHNRPVMLHLPMEPEEYPRVDPGPGALLTTMGPDELITQLRKDLQDVPGAVGVNNHMGSRLTRDSARLNQVFSVLKEQGLFFIDSRTTDKTVGYQSARLLKVPFAQRDVFLDHRQEADFVRRQIEMLIRRAEKNGQAIGIGHPHRVTLEALRELLPEIRRRVDLVPVADVVRPLS